MTSTEPKFQQDNVFEYNPINWGEEIDCHIPGCEHFVGKQFTFSAEETKFLNPQYVKEFAQQLRDCKGELLELMAVGVTYHLHKVYEYQLETTAYEKGLETIDINLPHFQLVANEDGQPLLKVNLTVEDFSKEADHLKQRIENIFQKAGWEEFWEGGARWILAAVLFLAFEAMKKDLGVATVKSLNQKELNEALYKYGFSKNSDAFRHVFNTFLQNISRVIIECQDLPNHSLVGLETLLGLRNKGELASVTEPQMFRTKFYEKYPSNAITNTIYTAGVTGRDIWEVSEKKLNAGKDFSKGHVKLQIRDRFDISDFEEIAYQAKEVIAQQFGEETLKLHYALAAIAFRKEAPWDDEITISLSKVLVDFGNNNKKNRYIPKFSSKEFSQLDPYISKEERLKQLAHQVRLLKRIEVWVPEWRATKKRVLTVEMSNLWDIFSIKEVTQLFTDGKHKIIDIEITYKPGLWFRKFVDSERKRGFGFITSEALKLDPIHDRMALRLAYFAVFALRQQKSCQFQIGRLLKCMGYGDEIAAAKTDPSAAWSLERSFKRGLKTLANFQHPYFFEFDPDAPEWAKPGSKTRKKPNGWFEIWLELPGTLHQPDTLPVRKDALTEPEKLLTRQTASKSSAIFDPLVFGQQVRQARKQKGETLTAMAESLKISKTQLSQIENGRYPTTINPKAKAQILAYLGLSD